MSPICILCGIILTPSADDLTRLAPDLITLSADTWRIVPSRFPPVSLFDRIASPADLDAVFAIEALTNDRIRDVVGEIALVPAADRVTGPGSTPIMAAFTHLNPEGGRYTTPDFGAWYAGLDLETAVDETRYHRARFLARTREAPIEIDMRVYVGRLDAQLHDLTAAVITWPVLAHSSDYGESQRLGARLRAAGSEGVLYPSVRRIGGTCVAAYRPRLISGCRQERHLVYCWDGTAISYVYEKRAFGAV